MSEVIKVVRIDESGDGVLVVLYNVPEMASMSVYLIAWCLLVQVGLVGSFMKDAALSHFGDTDVITGSWYPYFRFALLLG